MYAVQRRAAAISLILPVLQIILGLALLLLFFVQLSVGPTFLGVMVVGRGHGFAGVGRALALAVPYLLYTWLMWPVVAMGVWKQLRGNAIWAKTDREVVAPVSTDSGSVGGTIGV